MPRYRNILVGVDGSAPSVHALEEAIGLAKWGKGGVTVIHVALSYQGDLNLFGVRNIKAAIQGPGEQILTNTVELARDHSVSIRTIIDEGTVHERIAHHASAGDADLVVLGARRTSPVLRLLHGKTVSRVVELCHGDVMVIPDQAVIRWERVLLAFENSQCSQDEAVRAMELAVSYGAELRTRPVMGSCPALIGHEPTGKVHFPAKRSPECLETVQAPAGQAGIKYEGILSSGRLHRMVEKVAREERIGVIILGSDGERRSKWGLFRNPIGRMITGAPCPILFLKR